MIRSTRGASREHQEEGQIIPALLLVVVALIFCGLLFVQVGSAAEQKTQTQTAADSAAVAGAHSMRDFAIVQAGWQLTYSYSWIFKAVAVPNPMLATTACDAAQRNWDANPHGGAELNCSQVIAYPNAGGVQVNLTAPPGQVVSGPAQVQDKQAQADATAQVVLDQCPQLAEPHQKAIADWLIDTALTELGSAGGNCFTVADQALLRKLDTPPLRATAESVIGPPQPIYDAVRDDIRTELTND